MRNVTLRVLRFFSFILLGLLPAPLLALDHDNLDPNRPIGMEDAYAIPKGEIGMEGGVRFNDRREGRTRVIFQPQIIYGAFENAQIEIQGDLFTEPNSLVGASKSGDLHLGLLYNFNTETLALPAMALRVETDLPTGVNSRGVDTQVTGILTRSFAACARTSMLATQCWVCRRDRNGPGPTALWRRSVIPWGIPTVSATR